MANVNTPEEVSFVLTPILSPLWGERMKPEVSLLRS